MFIELCGRNCEGTWSPGIAQNCPRHRMDIQMEPGIKEKRTEYVAITPKAAIGNLDPQVWI